MSSRTVQLRLEIFRTASTSHATTLSATSRTLENHHRNRTESERSDAVDPRSIAQRTTGCFVGIFARVTAVDQKGNECHESSAVPDRVGGWQVGYRRAVSGEFEISSSATQSYIPNLQASKVIRSLRIPQDR